MSTFSQEELENLRVEIPKLQAILESSDENARKFFKDPFNFLRDRLNITIIARIADARHLIEDFNEAVRKLFNKLKKFLNKCFACKAAALILIYGALAKLGLPLLELIKKLDEILAVLEEFFKGTSKDSDRTLEKLKPYLDKIRPSTLAIKFCQIIGLCPLAKE